MMTDFHKENQRLREALVSILHGNNDASELKKLAEDALKVVPFKLEDTVHPDDALLVVTKLHRDKIQELDKTVKSMINFFKVWKQRELKNGNARIAEAIQLTIDSYSK